MRLFYPYIEKIISCYSPGLEKNYENPKVKLLSYELFLENLGFNNKAFLYFDSYITEGRYTPISYYKGQYTGRKYTIL